MKTALLPLLLVIAGVGACSSGSSDTAASSAASSSPSRTPLTVAETCTMVDTILDSNMPNPATQADLNAALEQLAPMAGNTDEQITAQFDALHSAIQVAAEVPSGTEGMSQAELEALGNAAVDFAATCQAAGIDLAAN